MSSVIHEGCLRFGIVGCGAIGPTHAAAISMLPDARLVAVADLVFDRAAKVAEKFCIPKIYTTDGELFADSNVDVVCLCTPSGFHADGAVAAMSAGKHVLIEKPMEVTLEACDRIIAAQRHTGRHVGVICQHRFDSVSMLVKEIIESDKLGKIVLATADIKWWRTQQYYDSGEWRGTWKLDGGGCLMNQGIHTVDLLQWLVGPVKSVSARTKTIAHERIEVEDVAVATLEFYNGALGTLVASTSAYEGLPARIDIFGTEGSAIIEGDRLKSLSLKNGQTYTTEEAAAHAVAVAQGGTHSVRDEPTHRRSSAPPGAVWGDAHRAQIQDFIRAVRNNTQPLIDAEAGRKPVEIILRVYESASTGKMVGL